MVPPRLHDDSVYENDTTRTWKVNASITYNTAIAIQTVLYSTSVSSRFRRLCYNVSHCSSLSRTIDPHAWQTIAKRKCTLLKLYKKVIGSILKLHVQANFIYRTRICRIHAKSCVSRIVYLNRKCFLLSNHGCGNYFYKSELPKLQINLLRVYELVKIVPTTSRFWYLSVHVILIYHLSNLHVHVVFTMNI